MRVDRLGQLFEQKYNLVAEALRWRDLFRQAAEPPTIKPYKKRGPHEYRKPEFPLKKVNFGTMSMAEIENFVRDKVDVLWNIPSKTNNLIRACADADAKNPKNEEDVKAVAGHKFCKELMSIVDRLKANRNSLPLSEIREGMQLAYDLIQKNRLSEDEDRTFPHVASLVFAMVPHAKKHDRRLRDQYYQKARDGFSKMAETISETINFMNEVGGSTQQLSGRFETEVTPLAIPEIQKFIRMHGDEYGIPDMATWSLVMNADPALDAPMRRVLRALDRGEHPADEGTVKPIIRDIKARHQALHGKVNVPALEQPPPSAPSPLAPAFEEEEDSKAWDSKMASKYNDLTLERYIK